MILPLLLLSVPMIAFLHHEPWWAAAWFVCVVIYLISEYFQSVEEREAEHG